MKKYLISIIFCISISIQCSEFSPANISLQLEALNNAYDNLAEKELVFFPIFTNSDPYFQLYKVTLNNDDTTAIQPPTSVTTYSFSLGMHCLISKKKHPDYDEFNEAAAYISSGYAKETHQLALKILTLLANADMETITTLQEITLKFILHHESIMNQLLSVYAIPYFSIKKDCVITPLKLRLASITNNPKTCPNPIAWYLFEQLRKARSQEKRRELCQKSMVYSQSFLQEIASNSKTQSSLDDNANN